MELDDNLKSKVRYHLVFNAGAKIPAGDRARLEEAMALVPDELWYSEIVYHVRRCDIAWRASAAIPDDYFDTGGSRILNPSRQEIISGDVERAISTSDPLKGDDYFREIYLRECDRLAETLYVPSHSRICRSRYSHNKFRASTLKRIPSDFRTSVIRNI